MSPDSTVVLDKMPRQIGRYLVLGRLADGGMAELFLGKLVGPSGFERPVVIKRILPHLARDPEFVAMFIDEARLAAGIRHPNVIQVQELGQVDGELFLVMEYLSGETVGGIMQRVASMGPLDPGIAAHLVAEAAAGLQAAHELTGPDGAAVGLVHRDISPDNLFVTYDGGVKVLDFGVAQAAGRLAKTQTGHRKGKFAYMAPEQIRGEPLDARVDVFALGVVLFEISTGKRLFKRKTDLLIMKAICEEPVPSACELVRGYPPALARVCARALARDPADRYQSARELRRALHAAAKRTHGQALGEDELRQLMQQTFPDRIAEKQQLLRDVVAGTPIERVPAAELGGGAWSETYDIRAQADRVQQKRSRGLGLALFAAASVTLAGGLLWSRARHPPQPERASTAPIERQRVELPVPLLPTMETVSIRIESTPPGAKVLIGGMEMSGTTPIELALPRTALESSLELRLAGHVLLRERIVLDTAQRLHFGLVPLPSPAAPKRSARPNPAPRDEAGFHRFE